jgi:hypothetical protein
MEIGLREFVYLLIFAVAGWAAVLGWGMWTERRHIPRR